MQESRLFAMDVVGAVGSGRQACCFIVALYDGCRQLHGYLLAHLLFGVLLTVGAVGDGSHGCVTMLSLGDNMRYDELWRGAVVSVDYSRRI
jgi:hypothetical protein